MKNALILIYISAFFGWKLEIESKKLSYPWIFTVVFFLDIYVFMDGVTAMMEDQINVLVDFIFLGMGLLRIFNY